MSTFLVQHPPPRPLPPACSSTNTIAMSSLAQTEERITKMEQTIAEAEAHLARLHVEMARLKAARNTFAPLMRLPDETLVSVATFVVSDASAAAALGGSPLPQKLLELTAVCTYLRSLYISTPELWTRIETTWGSPVMEMFAQRALLRPLHVVMRGSENVADPPLLKCLPQIQTLFIDISRSMDPYVIPEEAEDYEDMEESDCVSVTGMLVSEGIPQLRTLSFIGDRRTGWAFALHPLSYTGLTHLSICEVHVQSVPFWPALRTLCIGTECEILPSTLHQWLVQAPTLEGLSIQGVLQVGSQWLIDQVRQLSPLQLPALRRLYVQDVPDVVVTVLHMIPDPSHSLEVEVAVHRGESTESTYLTGILSRLKRCWERWGQPMEEFPSSTLICNIDYSYLHDHNWLVVGTPLASSSPPDAVAVYLKFVCYGGLAVLADLMGDVKSGHINYQHDPQHILIRPAFDDIALLSHVEELILERCRFDRFVYQEELESLAAWIIARHKQGTPVRSIKFCDSDRKGTMPLVQQLEAAGVAPSITWAK